MAAKSTKDDEPAALAALVPFEEGDFHALSAGLCRDPQYNDRRLVTRRKLATLAKQFAVEARADGLELIARTSLHNPHAFNQMRVKRLWAYLTRAAAEKKRLRAVLGPELGKDLDAAYRNAFLCIAIEEDALEVSLRIHPEAWYDGQNLLKRLKAEGLGPWQEQLNRLNGFRLRLHDWKGEWYCGQLTREKLEDYLKYYKPGEHRLSVEKRFPAPAGGRGLALSSAAPRGLLDELRTLLALYRFQVWSQESDFLFGG